MARRFLRKSAAPTFSKFALAEADDQHAAADFLGGVFGAAEQAVEARDQRLDVRREDAAGVEVGQQVLHGQERMDFARVEPQAGQFVLRAAVRVRGVEAVAAASSTMAIPDNGRIEPVAHVFEVALQGGARDFQHGHEIDEGHELAIVDHLVDLVEALSAIHGASALWSQWMLASLTGAGVDREPWSPPSVGRRQGFAEHCSALP
jgi:hypothetical protein